MIKNLTLIAFVLLLLGALSASSASIMGDIGDVGESNKRTSGGVHNVISDADRVVVSTGTGSRRQLRGGGCSSSEMPIVGFIAARVISEEHCLFGTLQLRWRNNFPAICREAAINQCRENIIDQVAQYCGLDLSIPEFDFDRLSLQDKCEDTVDRLLPL